MADLQVEAIHTAYGLSQVLFGVSLEVHAGECIALIGRNGVGKTTTMRSIIGAAVLYLLQIFTNQYTTYWPTVLGLILLVIVLVLPDGLIGLVDRLKAYRRGWQRT